MSEPRPLSPFEHLLFRDQRPGFPMCFFLHCHVEGTLDTDRLRAAVREASLRHPLLRSRVRDSWWRPSWRAPDVEPLLEIVRRADSGAGPRAGAGPWRPIDVRRTSGLRMVAIESSPDEWQVVLMIQHAVCDGLAGFEFFGDVWSCYHGAAPAPFRVPSRTVRRPAPAPPTAPPEPAAGTGGQTLGETTRFARFVPAALVRGPADVPAPATPDGLPFQPRWIDRQRSHALKERAAAAGVSVNDIVVAAVMRAALRWNEAAGRPSRRVRVTMPASLKPAGTRAAARVDMGYAFLDRGAEECRDPAVLVRSIGMASRWIQEHRAAEVFLDTLALVDRVPPAMRVVTRIPLPMSTAVVSYVGNVGPRMKIAAERDGGADLPGGLRIAGMSGVPPIRPGTRLAVGVVIYDGRICLTTLCDTRALGSAAAVILPALVHDEVEACALGLADVGRDDWRERAGAAVEP